MTFQPSSQSCGGSFSNSNGSPPRLPFLPPGAARAAAARRITLRFRCIWLAPKFQLQGIEGAKKKRRWLKHPKTSQCSLNSEMFHLMSKVSWLGSFFASPDHVCVVKMLKTPRRCKRGVSKRHRSNVGPKVTFDWL